MTTRPAYADWALRFVAAIGLGMSVLMAHEYLGPEATVCGEGGGCDVVRESRWAALLGIPTPIFGVLFFVAVLVASGLGGRARRALPALAIAGGLGAIGFIVLQASVIGAWCKFCLIADGSALAVALLALPAYRRPAGLPRWSAQLALGAVAAFTVAIPVGIARMQPRPPAAEPLLQEELPPAIAREQLPDVVTIVEFLDFQCPVCRKLHKQLTTVLRDYPAVHIVRRMMPLTSIHPHAEGAARAWCCADELGKGEQMAEALMQSSELDATACEELALSLGIDADTYRSCIDDPGTAERVRTERKEAQGMGIRSLPTFWIGREKFIGLPTNAVLRASLDRAVASLATPQRATQ